MNIATRSAREDHPRRFYAPDYRRRLRDAGALANISASANVVFAALCDRANAAGVAWPSAETIASDYGLGESTVRRAIGELVAVGLVLAVRRAGKVSRYVLTTPKMGASSSGKASDDGGHPARIETLPLPHRDPIMTNDHLHDHQEQHDSAIGAAVVVDEIRFEKSLAAKPPADTSEEDGMIAMLTPDLVDRARAIGLGPAKVNRYGAERVRGVLDALEAERTRKVIGNPAGWAMRALAENWELPKAVQQRALLITSTASAAAHPPEGTRWAREKNTDVVLEVLDVNESRVQFAGGIAVPAHRWGAWEWLVDHPGQPADAEGDVAASPMADGTIDAERRGTLARVAAWATIRVRSDLELEAKLAAAGLTIEEWRDYKTHTAVLEADAPIR